MSPESGHTHTHARTHTHTLCEPAQSKYMSTAQKSHFLQNFTGKVPRPRLGPERGHTLSASLRSQNACQDFTRATLCGNLPVKFRRPKPGRRLSASLRSRNAGQDFIKSHLIYGNLQEKCCGLKPRRRLCASLRNRNACQDFTRATFYGKLQVKCRGPEWEPWSSTGLVRTLQCGHCFWNFSSKIQQSTGFRAKM